MSSLRNIFSRFFNYNWKFGLFIILLFGIPRFILVLQANISGGYGQAGSIFLLMWFAPLIFLTRQGRKEIGFKRPKNFLSLLYVFSAGVLTCLTTFFLFQWLFGNSLSNAFAITHLCHFGVIYTAGTWDFLPLPSLLWLVAMFMVGQVAFRCKQRSESIYGAVLSHSGFNLAMMYVIFYLI